MCVGLIIGVSVSHNCLIMANGPYAKCGTVDGPNFGKVFENVAKICEMYRESCQESAVDGRRRTEARAVQAQDAPPGLEGRLRLALAERGRRGLGPEVRRGKKYRFTAFFFCVSSIRCPASDRKEVCFFFPFSDRKEV